MIASNRRRSILFHLQTVPVLGTVMFLYGCTTPPDATAEPPADGGIAHVPLAGTPAAPAPVTPAARRPLAFEPTGPIVLQDAASPAQGVVDARPAAIVNGRMVYWSELKPTLNELAGAEALQESILDRTIADALLAASITLSPDDIAAERKLLLESLNDDADLAMRQLDELRARQNLGKARFEALMRRNAGLRALVKPSVRINDAAVREMHEMVHGSKRQARLMTLATLDSAQAAINLVKSGVSFGDVAVEMSTDAGAARGGLMDQVSRVDPAYPEALRETLWSLNPGEMSGPILLGDQYAVLMLVKRIAADDITLEESKPSLERKVQISQERLLMDQMARKMLSEASVKVIDDQLNESWGRRKRIDK